MPYLFYSGAPVGTRLVAVAPDNSSFEMELADAPVPPVPDACAVPYTPAFDTDWGIPAPAFVCEGLDQEATTKRSILTGASGLTDPASPFAYSIPSNFIIPVKSGIFLIWWHWTCLVANAGNITFEPTVDGTTAGVAGTAITSTSAANEWISVNSMSRVTLNRAVNHTAGMNLTWSGGAGVSQGVLRIMTWET